MRNGKNKVFVTGMGIISSLGIGVQQNLDRLIEGRSGIGAIRHLKTRLSSELIAGEVPFSNDELISIAGIQDTTGISRAALLGIIAAISDAVDLSFSDMAPGIRKPSSYFPERASNRIALPSSTYAFI